MIYFVTYATHSEGMFEKLVNNKFNISVEVLGWGTKYTGHTDKYRGVLAYLKSRKDDDIVCFVDGFDSEIVKPESEIYMRFRESESKVLFSNASTYENTFARWLFPPCKNGHIINTGLYMGFTKYLKVLLQHALQSTCKDDQLNMNRLCELHDFIDVDTNERIFKNMPNEETDACILSYPGQMMTPRKFLFSRTIYTQYFIEVIVLVLLLGAYKIPSLRWYVAVLIAVLFLLFFTGKIDSSCVIA